MTLVIRVARISGHKPKNPKCGIHLVVVIVSIMSTSLARRITRPAAWLAGTVSRKPRSTRMVEPSTASTRKISSFSWITSSACRAAPAEPTTSKRSAGVTSAASGRLVFCIWLRLKKAMDSSTKIKTMAMVVKIESTPQKKRKPLIRLSLRRGRFRKSLPTIFVAGSGVTGFCVAIQVPYKLRSGKTRN
jgi:hypothetical protein